MTRAPCCEKNEVKKGPWTPEEDELLVKCIAEYGEGNWSSVPKKAGLVRCGKSCRLRWANYLRPDLKRGTFSPEEEDLIIRLHKEMGNRWAKIALELPGRTDNDIKNHWNTRIKKKLRDEGICPETHKPLPPPLPPGADGGRKRNMESGEGGGSFKRQGCTIITPEVGPITLLHVPSKQQILLKLTHTITNSINNTINQTIKNNAANNTFHGAASHPPHAHTPWHQHPQAPPSGPTHTHPPSQNHGQGQVNGQVNGKVSRQGHGVASPAPFASQGCHSNQHTTHGTHHSHGAPHPGHGAPHPGHGHLHPQAPRSPYHTSAPPPHSPYSNQQPQPPQHQHHQQHQQHQHHHQQVHQHHQQQHQNQQQKQQQQQQQQQQHHHHHHHHHHPQHQHQHHHHHVGHHQHPPQPVHGHASSPALEPTPIPPPSPLSVPHMPLAPGNAGGTPGGCTGQCCAASNRGFTPPGQGNVQGNAAPLPPLAPEEGKGVAAGGVATGGTPPGGVVPQVAESTHKPIPQEVSLGPRIVGPSAGQCLEDEESVGESREHHNHNHTHPALPSNLNADHNHTHPALPSNLNADHNHTHPALPSNLNAAHNAAGHSSAPSATNNTANGIGNSAFVPATANARATGAGNATAAANGSNAAPSNVQSINANGQANTAVRTSNEPSTMPNTGSNSPANNTSSAPNNNSTGQMKSMNNNQGSFSCITCAPTNLSPGALSTHGPNSHPHSALAQTRSHTPTHTPTLTHSLSHSRGNSGPHMHGAGTGHASGTPGHNTGCMSQELPALAPNASGVPPPIPQCTNPMSSCYNACNAPRLQGAQGTPSPQSLHPLPNTQGQGQQAMHSQLPNNVRGAPGPHNGEHYHTHNHNANRNVNPSVPFYGQPGGAPIGDQKPFGYNSAAQKISPQVSCAPGPEQERTHEVGPTVEGVPGPVSGVRPKAEGGLRHGHGHTGGLPPKEGAPAVRNGSGAGGEISSGVVGETVGGRHKQGVLVVHPGSTPGHVSGHGSIGERESGGAVLVVRTGDGGAPPSPFMLQRSFWNGEESGELWSSDEDMDVAALALPSPQIMAPGSALNAALEDITCFGTLGDLTSFDHAPGGMGVVSAVGGGAGNGGSGGVLGVGSMVAGVGMNALGRGHGGVMMVHVSGDGELMLDEDKGHRTDPQVFEDMLKVAFTDSHCPQPQMMPVQRAIDIA